MLYHRSPSRRRRSSCRGAPYRPRLGHFGPFCMRRATSRTRRTTRCTVRRHRRSPPRHSPSPSRRRTTSHRLLKLRQVDAAHCLPGDQPPSLIPEGERGVDRDVIAEDVAADPLERLRLRLLAGEVMRNRDCGNGSSKFATLREATGSVLPPLNEVHRRLPVGFSWHVSEKGTRLGARWLHV